MKTAYEAMREINEAELGNTNEAKDEEYDYSVLPEAIIDCLSTLGSKKLSSYLRGWEFSSDFKLAEYPVVSGNKFTIVLDTPKGKKKIIVTAVLSNK
jgi:hypothetical protein